MNNLSSPIGLVAGNGNFPLEFVEHARARGLEVVVVAHTGETDPRIEELAAHCCWIRVGQIGRLLRTFIKNRVKQAAFVGGIRRTRLFSGVRLDFKALSILARVGSVRDDRILRGVAEELERNGIEVFGASLLLEKSVPARGLLTRRGLTPAERQDARVGWEAAKAVGALDIGQTVVVYQGAVVAVEAIEGTDAAVLRAGQLGGTAGKVLGREGRAAGLVVVKLVKPHQDVRFDLPAAGPGTIETMQQAGATALVLEAGRAVMLKPQETIAAANEAGIAVVALAGCEDLPAEQGA